MYSIYANGEVLHHPNLYDKNYITINPTLVDELNAHGTLQFTLPRTHPLYDSLKTLYTRITVKEDGEEIWWGRVYSQKTDIKKNRVIYCEGQLAFLCDSTIQPYVFKGTVGVFFTELINRHNQQQTDTTKQFSVGNISSNLTGTSIVRSSETPDKIWNVITDKILEPLGAYIKIRKVGSAFYLDLTDEITDSCGQEIVYGKNLIDLFSETKSDEVYTVLYPYGAVIDSTTDPDYETEPVTTTSQPFKVWDASRRTIKTVNSGVPYIEDQTGIALYGRIVHSEVWDDITTASYLLTKAQAELQKAIYKNISISAHAVDLSLLDDTKPKIKVGQLVTIISQPHNINISLLCEKIQIPLMDLGKTKIQLGASYKALTDYTT